MNWQNVADALFPQGHRIVERDFFLSGEAQVGGDTVTVIGTTDCWASTATSRTWRRRWTWPVAVVPAWSRWYTANRSVAASCRSG
jgi:hypothetical protein